MVSGILSMQGRVEVNFDLLAQLSALSASLTMMSTHKVTYTADRAVNWRINSVDIELIWMEMVQVEVITVIWSSFVSWT